MSDFNPCLTEECKTRCDSYGAYCEDICIKEIERNREAIAELRSALKLALKALPFSTHPDAFEAVQVIEKLINTTKETK